MAYKEFFISQEIDPQPDESDTFATVKTFTTQCRLDESKHKLSGKIETFGRRRNEYGYRFDARGHLTRVARDGYPVEEYVYNSSGQRISSMERYTGLAAAYTYAADGRLTAVDFKDRTISGPVRDPGRITYTYWPGHGALAAKTQKDQTTSYHYDQKGRLCLAYLPGGRNLHYHYDDPRASTQPTHKYDGRAFTHEYAWHDMFRLKSCCDHVQGLKFEFHYGERRAPAWLIIRELPGRRSGRKPGDCLLSNATPPGPNEPDFHAHLLNRKFLCGHDQVGSLKLITDTQGNEIKAMDYDSFGNVIEDTAPHLILPLGFSGALTDSDTGLVHLGYREYDPLIGRFISPDPLGDTGGDHDLYDYCVDDPVSSSDPTGLFDPLTGFLIVKGVGLAIGLLGAYEAAQIADTMLENSGKAGDDKAVDGVTKVVPRLGVMSAGSGLGGLAVTGQLPAAAGTMMSAAGRGGNALAELGTTAMQRGGAALTATGTVAASRANDLAQNTAARARDTAQQINAWIQNSGAPETFARVSNAIQQVFYSKGLQNAADFAQGAVAPVSPGLPTAAGNYGGLASDLAKRADSFLSEAEQSSKLKELAHRRYPLFSRQPLK